MVEGKVWEASILPSQPLLHFLGYCFGEERRLKEIMTFTSLCYGDICKFFHAEVLFLSLKICMNILRKTVLSVSCKCHARDVPENKNLLFSYRNYGNWSWHLINYYFLMCMMIHYSLAFRICYHGTEILHCWLQDLLHIFGKPVHNVSNKGDDVPLKIPVCAFS